MALNAKLTSSEVDRLITDAVAAVIVQLPYNGQDTSDKELAEYFIAKKFAQHFKPKVDKYEKKVKELIKTEIEPGNKVTENYSRTMSVGTPRETFDKDAFITKVAADHNIPKYKLVEAAASCTKTSATPISLDVEYIGDVKRNV